MIKLSYKLLVLKTYFRICVPYVAYKEYFWHLAENGEHEMHTNMHSELDSTMEIMISSCLE